MDFTCDKKNISGFTLSEALVTISVLITISLIVFSLIIASYRVVSTQRAYVNLQQEGAQVIREITKAANMASAVTDYPETVPTYVSNNSQLALKLISINTDGNPIADTYDYFVFYVEDNTLKLLIDANPLSTGREDKTRVISNFVEKIIFGYNTTTPTDADFIYITSVMGKTVNKEEKQIISQSSAYLRN